MICLDEIDFLCGQCLWNSVIGENGLISFFLCFLLNCFPLLLLHFIKENQAGFAEALKEYAGAELLSRQKKSSEAIAVFTSTLQAFPDSPLVDDALIQKAELSIVVKQYNDALLSYQKLLTDYPKSILRDKAQFGLGELYQMQLKDKEKAIQAYEEVLAAYPNSLFVEEARTRIRTLRGDAL